MRKLLLILLFAILVSASFVAAFSLSTDSSSYDVCRGSTSTIITSVTGTGSFDAVSEGDAALFTTTVPGSFSLSDGTQSVYSYVNPPSNTKEGQYSLEVEVSSGGEVQSQNYDINVKDCHGSSLNVAPEKLTCACEETTYSLTLENKGEFTETFDLSVSGLAKDWVTFSTDEITINSGAKKQFTATVAPPCNVHGIYELKFKAKARESLASASGSSNLDIQPCYEYELGFDKESYSICENVKTEVSVKINNLGTSDNNFKIGLNGPKWVSSENNVNVESSEEGVIILTVYPIIGESGEYDLEVETLTSNGAVKKLASTKLVVEKCHEISAQLNSDEEIICNLEKSYSYQLSIANSGNLPDTISLELEGPEWVVLNDKKVVLSPEQERSVLIELELPSDVEKKTYDINVKVSSENGAESEVGFKLRIAEETECYDSELNFEEDSLVVGLEKGKTFSLILKNNGLEESTFKISLEGSADGFSLINPESVTLEPGAEEKLFLFISPQLYVELGKYNLEVNAIVKETGLTISEKVDVEVVEKVDEKGEVIKEKKEGDGNIFTGLLSKVWAFLKNPLSIFENAREAVEEEVNGNAAASDEEVEEETSEEVVEETVEEELDVDEEVEEDLTEEETTDNEEVVEETVEEELVEEAEEETSEEVVEEELDVDEIVEEDLTEEETTDNEEVVEEVEEKEGFWSRIFSFFQIVPNTVEDIEVVEELAVEEESTEETVEEVVEEIEEVIAEPVTEEEVAEEVVEETVVEELTNSTEEEVVVETAEVTEELTNTTETAEETNATEENVVEEEETVAEATSTSEEAVEEVVDETVDEETTDEEEEEEEEEVEKTTKTVEVDGTTVEIDLDSLIDKDQESNKISSFDFSQFKWYLGGALIIISLVILLSTGVMRKVIGFFEEE